MQNRKVAVCCRFPIQWTEGYNWTTSSQFISIIQSVRLYIAIYPRHIDDVTVHHFLQTINRHRPIIVAEEKAIIRSLPTFFRTISPQER